MGLLRTVIEFSNRALGRVKASRMVGLPQGLPNVRLNLGCGLGVTQGWINIDGSLNALVAGMPSNMHVLMYRLTGAKQYYSQHEYCRILREHIFVHHDLSKNIPFRNDMADYIYSSHFLEHLYRNDALNLLKECYRVLKKEGVLRISVPDLEHAVKLYLIGKKHETLQNYFFVENDESHYARHKYMYDFEMLSALLRDIGFCKIQRCEFQVGTVPDIDILDNRPGESLFLEAVK